MKHLRGIDQGHVINAWHVSKYLNETLETGLSRTVLVKDNRKRVVTIETITYRN